MRRTLSALVSIALWTGAFAAPAFSTRLRVVPVSAGSPAVAAAGAAASNLNASVSLTGASFHKDPSLTGADASFGLAPGKTQARRSRMRS